MNALTNMRSTRDLDDLTIDEIAQIEIEELKALYDQNIDEFLSSATRKKKMQSAFHQKLDAPHIGSKRSQGVKVSTSKKVSWTNLDKLYEQIKEEGGNPDNYIKRQTVYKVAEASYNSWTQDTQDRFLKHRSVKPGTLSVEFYDDV